MWTKRHVIHSLVVSDRMALNSIKKFAGLSYTHVYTHIHIHTDTQTQKHTAHTHTHTHIYIYIYIYIYTVCMFCFFSDELFLAVFFR